jgi:hypothetical protein
MKKKNNIWFYPVTIMIILSGFLYSCNKKLPLVYTDNITDITTTTATCNARLSGDGGAWIHQFGVYWGTSSNSTTYNIEFEEGTISGDESYSIPLTGLTPNTLYYIRAYAINQEGTGYGNEISFSTSALSIGDSYGGGIVFYLNGQHGLIASTNDQGTGNEWGCQGTTISGADGTTTGTGNQNTIDIESGCSSNNTAADLCSNLILNGYDDWFLPSKDELNLMYTNRLVIGGFTNNKYWSSSEFDSNTAWSQNFTDGTQNSENKSGTNYIRAIRAF